MVETKIKKLKCWWCETVHEVEQLDFDDEGHPVCSDCGHTTAWRVWDWTIKEEGSE